MWVRTGKIGLVSGVAGTKAAAWITSKDRLTRKADGDSAFTAAAHSDSRPGAVLVVFQLCAPSADGTGPYLMGLAEACSLDSGRLRTTSCSVLPGPCMVTGKLRIPSDRWIPLREGMEVRGGGVLLDTNGARLLSGTEVAELAE
ncbi:MAG: hypothetical protein J7M14_02190 [Planctomycetes bacterium]|nr:hypothetical protein [Planctomycetota bacterium]